MFNRTIVQAPRGPSTIVKREHRAPTDESVRLLAEMEAAAEAKILKTIRLEKNGFNAVLQLIVEARSGDTKARCVFDLNGKQIIVEESISVEETMDAQIEGGQGQHALLRKLLTTAAERIAGEIIIPAYAAQAQRITF